MIVRMLLLAWGSRGDVQPCVALGRGLAAAGVRVTVAAGEDFETMITSAGLGFHPFKINMAERMQQPPARAWLAGSRRLGAEIGLMRDVVRSFVDVMADGLIEMMGTADAYISGALTLDPMLSLAAEHDARHILGMLQPAVPTTHGASTMYPLLSGRNSVLNRWWGYAQAAGTLSIVRPVGDEVRRRLRLPKQTFRSYTRAALSTPTLIGVSRLVAPPAPDWGDRIHLTGYWAEPAPADYRPPSALADFLLAGDPPVYLGFGSMPSCDALAELMTLAARRGGRRAVILGDPAGAASDAAPVTPVSDDVIVIEPVPHEWLFPRMRAVVHHGGAGTTAAAFRAGIPQGIIPHIADQPYWGRRVHALGVGPEAVARHRLTLQGLTGMVTQLTSIPTMALRAADLGSRLLAEDGVSTAVETILRLLD